MKRSSTDEIEKPDSVVKKKNERMEKKKGERIWIRIATNMLRWSKRESGRGRRQVWNARESRKVWRDGRNWWRKRWMIGNNGSQSGGRIHVSESVRLSGTRRSTTQRFEQQQRLAASKPLLDLQRARAAGLRVSSSGQARCRPRPT